MSTLTEPGVQPGRAALDVLRWAREICTADTDRAPDIAAAMGTSVAGMRRIGYQLPCPPPPGVDRLELVLSYDNEQVILVEFAPNRTVMLSELVALLGPGVEAYPSPRDARSHTIFDDLWPEGAARGCTVVARTPRDAPEPAAVMSVVLYLQPRRRP